MKLYKITSKKGILHLGEETEEKAKAVFKHIYPHIEIEKIEELKL